MLIAKKEIFALSNFGKVSKKDLVLAVSAKITSDPGLIYNDLPKLKLTGDVSDEDLRKQDEELKAARKSMQHNIAFALILGLPLLFTAFGLIRWRMRLTANENISLA